MLSCTLNIESKHFLNFKGVLKTIMNQVDVCYFSKDLHKKEASNGGVLPLHLYYLEMLALETGVLGRHVIISL